MGYIVSSWFLIPELRVGEAPFPINFNTICYINGNVISFTFDSTCFRYGFELSLWGNKNVFPGTHVFNQLYLPRFWGFFILKNDHNVW